MQPNDYAHRAGLSTPERWPFAAATRALTKRLIVGLAVRGWLSPATAQWLIYVGGLIHE